MNESTGFKNNIVKYSFKFFIAIVIIVFFYILSKIINYAITKIITEKNINKLLLYNLCKVALKYIIIFFGIMFGLVYLGINLNSILLLFGSIGFIVAISIQSTISQIVSGGLILFFDYFNINDLIQVNTKVGYVSGFTLLNTTITDYFGVKHRIPNNEITNSNFTNYFANKNILCNVYITISSNNSIDYKKIFKNIETAILQECPYVIDPKSVSVKVSDTSSFGTTIVVMFLIENINYYSAQYSAKLIARDYLSKNDILLLDQSYLSGISDGYS